MSTPNLDQFIDTMDKKLKGKVRKEAFTKLADLFKTYEDKCRHLANIDKGE